MRKTVLLSPGKKQYKANLHCHSTRSDGSKTPEELKALYKENGYSVLAITDHCSPKDHSALTDPDFLLLTGYEAYIRSNEAGLYDPFAAEIHLNLFAKDPGNETLICYNPRYTKYVPAEEHASLRRAGSEEPRRYTVEYINRFIRTAVDNGYLVGYNHPFWSMESEERILSYENIFSLEMYNTSSHMLNNIEGAEALYDLMMRRGMRLGCHAGDDNHNGRHGNDSLGWYTVILSDRLEYSEIVGALEAHEYYASNGPELRSISLTSDEGGERVSIECSPATKAFVYFGGKVPAFLRLPEGESRTAFEFAIPPRARYFRVTVYDEAGHVANSRGFFRDEWEGAADGS